MVSVPVWVLCLITGVVLLAMRRGAKGLATILGAIVGALVGFGSCLGFGSLLSLL
jgi:hypothetical protein